MIDEIDLCLEIDDPIAPRESTQNKLARGIKKIPKRPPLKISDENLLKQTPERNIKTKITNINHCDKSMSEKISHPVEDNKMSAKSGRSKFLLEKLRKAQCSIQSSQKSSIGDSKDDLLNNNENNKCSVESNSELEISKKFKTEISYSKVEDASETGSLSTKSSQADTQDEPQKFLYPLLKKQTLISTNIYSGSLCTPKEFTTQPSSSSQTQWSLSSKIWSTPDTPIQKIEYLPPIKTERGFVKVNPIQNCSTIDQEIKKSSKLTKNLLTEIEVTKSLELDCQEFETQKSVQLTSEKTKLSSVKKDQIIIDQEIKETPKSVKEFHPETKVKEFTYLKDKFETQKSIKLNPEKTKQDFVKSNLIQSESTTIDYEIKKSLKLMKEVNSTKVKKPQELKSKFETIKATQLSSEKPKQSFEKSNPVQNDLTLINQEIKKPTKLIKEFSTETKGNESLECKDKESVFQKSTQLTSEDDTKIEAVSNKESVKCYSTTKEQDATESKSNRVKILMKKLRACTAH